MTAIEAIKRRRREISRISGQKDLVRSAILEIDERLVTIEKALSLGDYEPIKGEPLTK